MKEKLADPEWKPDFGPAVFNARTGATAIGARDFLVAFNVNLNTSSVKQANAIAFDVREKGRLLRKQESGKGNIAEDMDDESIVITGSLKSVKAIGWFIKEYGFTQISMNITNISVTPVHIAFDEVCKKSDARGIRVTGSELVGLIPLRSMIEAGKYFLKKQHRSTGISDEELIKIAIKSMGMNDIHKFVPEEKIIEYVIADKGKPRLIDLSLKAFMDETASELPAPGGGSVSSYLGALGVSLGTMVANLSGHKRGWEDQWEKFSDWAEKGKKIQNRLLNLVDDDTDAYNGIIDAYKFSGKTEEEKVIRENAIQSAIKRAIMVPFSVMETAYEGFEILKAMVNEGNPSSVSDAGVGALALLTCIKGAFLNVRINASGLNDKDFATEIVKKGDKIASMAVDEEKAILKIMESKISR